MCILCFINPVASWMQSGINTFTLLSAFLLVAQAVALAVTVFARLFATPVIVQDKENKDEEATIDVDTTPIATITHAQLPANPDKRKKTKTKKRCATITHAQLPANPDKRKKKKTKKRWNNKKKNKSKKKKNNKAEAAAAATVETTATAKPTDSSSPAVIEAKTEEGTVTTTETTATAEGTDIALNPPDTSSLAVFPDMDEEGTVATIETTATAEDADTSFAFNNDKHVEGTVTAIETIESTSLIVIQVKHQEETVTTIETTESTDTSIVLSSSENNTLANVANAAGEIKNLGEGDEMVAVEATVTTVALPPSADMQTKPKVVDSDPTTLLAGAQVVTSSKSLEELVAEGGKTWAETKQASDSLFGLS
eukprot:CAMPEP_0113640960 /NCGR_PEP_ID=MMETSP0017_2-20120614/21500_1 /TAXON_ID=2856 /ORGANISM="Cylindrotheca closterium" /LENGTH=367 /DNA_ID=CAMNT_0000552273 /DNA_START=186 /DNA_END=1284 /DNA_ORIENTATION=+ /assembly_acc=CAM_ASM_000147